MIALDTNLLIYAHRAGTPQHPSAKRAIEAALNSGLGCGITLPTLSEFWSIVTHPASTGKPSTARQASEFISALVESGLFVWSPGPLFGERLMQAAVDLKITGVRVFDLQIALTAFDNGAHEIWSHDAQFATLPGLKLVDPLR